MNPVIRINPSIIKQFQWLPIQKLHRHERTNPRAITSLVEHIKNGTNNLINNTPATIPAVLACNRTFTIIDGHHRFEALKKLNISYVPTLLIDYNHKDIILRASNGMTKKDVIDVALSAKLLEPKQTAHLVREMYTYKEYPLPVLSPICPVINPDVII
jgi:hypothetical protein